MHDDAKTVIRPHVSVWQPSPPSRRLQAAAAAERVRIQRDLERLAERREKVIDRLASLDEARASLVARLEALETSVGRATGFPTTDEADEANQDGALRGAAIRIRAVSVLLDRRPADRPIHYRQWFELLEAAGFVVGGQNPQATFLTQIGRSPLVRKADGPGEYMIDTGFEHRGRQRLAGLREQLRALHDREDSDPARLREVRAERRTLTAEIERTERALEEAAAAWAGIESLSPGTCAA